MKTSQHLRLLATGILTAAVALWSLTAEATERELESTTDSQMTLEEAQLIETVQTQYTNYHDAADTPTVQIIDLDYNILYEGPANGESEIYREWMNNADLIYSHSNTNTYLVTEYNK